MRSWVLLMIMMEWMSWCSGWVVREKEMMEKFRRQCLFARSSLSAHPSWDNVEFNLNRKGKEEWGETRPISTMASSAPERGETETTSYPRRERSLLQLYYGEVVFDSYVMIQCGEKEFLKWSKMKANGETKSREVGRSKRRNRRWAFDYPNLNGRWNKIANEIEEFKPPRVRWKEELYLFSSGSLLISIPSQILPTPPTSHQPPFQSIRSRSNVQIKETNSLGLPSSVWSSEADFSVIFCFPE